MTCARIVSILVSQLLQLYFSINCIEQLESKELYMIIFVSYYLKIISCGISLYVY